jgi:Zn-finger nucleic acid-binding protein
MANESSNDAASQAACEPIKVTDQGAEIICPRCGVEMVFGELLRTKIVACNKCHGILVQTADFGLMVDVLRRDYVGTEDKPRPIDSHDLEVVVQCPACWNKMEVHPYCGPGNIVIDSCAKCCLVWLDGGELVRVIRGAGKR